MSENDSKPPILWDDLNVKVFLHWVASCCCTAWSRITPLIHWAACKGCTVSLTHKIRPCFAPGGVSCHHTKTQAQHHAQGKQVTWCIFFPHPGFSLPVHDGISLTPWDWQALVSSHLCLALPLAASELSASGQGNLCKQYDLVSAAI